MKLRIGFIKLTNKLPLHYLTDKASFRRENIAQVELTCCNKRL